MRVYKENGQITASGDQACIIWDVESAHYTSVFQSHVSSVKSVDTHPTEKSKF